MPIDIHSKFVRDWSFKRSLIFAAMCVIEEYLGLDQLLIFKSDCFVCKRGLQGRAVMSC